MDKGNLRNAGMGGVGISNGSPFYANVMNPALLIHTQYVVFEASYLGEYKELSIDNQSITDAGGNLLNLHLGFPILKGRYTMGVGLRPSTMVNYEFSQRTLLEDANTFVDLDNKGSGGVSQAYWSHGVKIAKGISVGVEAIYNFGSVTDERTSTLLDPTLIATDVIDVIDRTTFSDVTFRPGILLSEKIDTATYLNFGMTYEKSVDLDVDYSREVERRTRNGSPINVDSVDISTEQITLPDVFNFGLSFEKTLKYTIGADFSYQKWSQYKNTLQPENLRDAWRLSIGGEFTPDATSVSSYLKRVTYRAGLRYYKTPWVVNDVQIEDIGINFGFSLPVSRGLSQLNLAFTVGERGSQSNSLLKERYYRVGLGISINDPQWFRRRKIN